MEGRAASKREAAATSPSSPGLPPKRARLLPSPAHDLLERAPDFFRLAAAYPSFRPFVTAAGVDFRDPAAVRAVTCVLMLHYYGLKVEVPRDALCPPVPQRLSYLRWVSGLPGLGQRGARASLLDVGTGALAVLPLLAARDLGWDAVGTDTDRESVLSARRLVERNGLGARVQVREVEADAPFFGRGERFDAVVCNPPFFDHEDERRQHPSRGTAARRTELFTDGGERAFIARMARESSAGVPLGWVSCMLGRKCSVPAVTGELAGLSGGPPAAVRTAALRNGKVTRWAVAWTFDKDMAAADRKAVLDEVLGKTE